MCVCVEGGKGEGVSKKKSDRASSEKRGRIKDEEMRGRTAERPNCYLNQAAMKTSQ